jgi:Tetratricopeptide repeat/O-Antigen ligase
VNEGGIQPLRLSAAGARILIAAIVLGGTGVLFAWWGLEQGAYFNAQFYPGAIAVFALLGLLAVAAPLRARIAGPVLVALAALTGLAFLTLLSLLWTPSQDSAVAYSERIFLYAALFAIGLIVSRLLGERALLVLVPVGAAVGFAGIVTVFTLWGGSDVTAYFHGDATLRYPIGYRNADATFFLIGAWCLLALAASGRGHWALRATAIAGVTMLAELAVLSQSRGSLPAAVAGLLVFIVVAGDRLRAAACIALAALPVLPALPTLLDVYQHGDANQAMLPLLDRAARAILLTTILSGALAALALWGLAPRVRLSSTVRTRLGLGLAVASVATVAVAGTVLLAERGGPIEFLDQKVSEFKYAGNPDLSAQGTRFGLNVGSNRRDFFRVAIDEGEDHPILGGGAGAFPIAYLEHRRSTESPRDPHSMELIIWAELGLAGVALLVAFLVGSTIAVLRTRRTGPAGAALATGALAAGADWLFHSSYDWFWYYPALTAVAIFLLGAAAGPGLSAGAGVPRPARIATATIAGAVLLLAVPLYLSDRYTDRAYDEWRADRDAAYRDLDRAADLNPYIDRPLLAKGLIAGRTDDTGTALEAYREALDRQPDNYAGHYLLARLLSRLDRPVAAAAEMNAAHRLNPLDPTISGLREEMLAAAREAERSRVPADQG